MTSCTEHCEKNVFTFYYFHIKDHCRDGGFCGFYLLQFQLVQNGCLILFGRLLKPPLLPFQPTAFVFRVNSRVCNFSLFKEFFLSYGLLHLLYFLLNPSTSHILQSIFWMEKKLKCIIKEKLGACYVKLCIFSIMHS